MSALNKTVKPAIKRLRINNEVLVVEPSNLFRVVVNNFRQKERDNRDVIENEADEAVVDEQQGLPPQPAGYMKFPTYDWF